MEWILTIQRAPTAARIQDTFPGRRLPPLKADAGEERGHAGRSPPTGRGEGLGSSLARHGIIQCSATFGVICSVSPASAEAAMTSLGRPRDDVRRGTRSIAAGKGYVLPDLQPIAALYPREHRASPLVAARGFFVSIEPRLVPRSCVAPRAPRSAMEPVSMRIVPCVPVISAAAIGAALAIGSGSALAADCLTKPSRDAPSGQHWYYRLDRGTDRKCWYLHATVTGASEAPGMELQSVRPQRRQAAAPQRPAARSEADEAALYLEFLRWKEQHRDAR